MAREDLIALSGRPDLEQTWRIHDTSLGRRSRRRSAGRFFSVVLSMADVCGDHWLQRTAGWYRWMNVKILIRSSIDLGCVLV